MDVVLVPFVAFGHMMPFHQLAVALAKAGVRVSYISTPANIRRLPEPPSNLASLISFVAFPMPVLPGSNSLPEGAEATVDVPLEKTSDLTMAFDLLRQPFKEFVATHSPDWIITDFLPHWTADVARECGVPLASFSAFSSAAKVYFGPPEFLTGEGLKRVRATAESLTSPPHWVTFPSTVAYRRFEATGALHGFFGPNPSGMAVAERVAKTLSASKVVAIRGCRELDGEYLSLYSKLLGKPVIPVGLLSPEPPKQREISDDKWSETFKWLDVQRPKSVVFVGFGSECKLNKEDVFKIAEGLEISELPFIWALGKPSWAIDDSEALPKGFAERTGERGKVCIGWAPQIQILAHPSLGGSLFHAGWGSVIETLQFGHAMVVLPLIIDQGLNARFLVEKGLAIEVERGEDGSFNGGDIAKALRQAMVGKDGEEMRARLKEAAAIAGDKELHDQYVDEFVQILKAGVN